MSTRNTIGSLLVTSLLLLGAGYILSNSVDFNLCTQIEYDCRELFNRIGDPTIYFAPALSVIFLVLLFTPRAFHVWKKFATWFIPVAVLIFIFSPEPRGNLFTPFPEQVFQWVSIIYVIASLGIIGWSIAKGKTAAPTNR